MSLSRLHDHLATHMEEIALFVLPLTPDDDDDDDEGEEKKTKEIFEDISERDEEDEQIEEIAENVDKHDEEDEQIKENTENPDASDHLIWESETAQKAADDTRSLEFIDQYQQQATNHQALPSFADGWRLRNREPGSQAAADDLLDSHIGSPFSYDFGKAPRLEKTENKESCQCKFCPQAYDDVEYLGFHMKRAHSRMLSGEKI